MRDGPGLLLRDILAGDDPQVNAVAGLIAQTDPDVIALQGIDYDLENAAALALIESLETLGVSLPFLYAPPTNAGLASGVDLNGNGQTDDPDDAQGFGRFSGQGGMVLLSRFPIISVEAQDFSTLLWRDFPGSLFPFEAGQPFGGQDAFDTQRLSSKGHWRVPVQTPNQGTVTFMVFHATPPVFDGPEDRNGRRNHDELAFWSLYLDGAFTPPPPQQFVLLGDANIDPERGEGRKDAIHKLLSDPRLQTPFDNTPTADWREPTPGDMRVDYLMPSADWRIVDHGRLSNPIASRHTLLWVDLDRADP